MQVEMLLPDAEDISKLIADKKAAAASAPPAPTISIPSTMLPRNAPTASIAVTVC